MSAWRALADKWANGQATENDQARPESEQRGMRQPLLSIACDQGPIGFSAYFYKVHQMNLHAILLPAPTMASGTMSATRSQGWVGMVASQS